MIPTIIPVIKNCCPEILAKDIISVQPMCEDAGHIFRFREPGVGSGTEYPKGGLVERHTFRTGWEVMYHGQWIPQDVWWKLKIKGF